MGEIVIPKRGEPRADFPPRRGVADPTAKTALYRLYNADGDLLYVGISSDPWRRFIQHTATTAWWPEVVELRLARFPNRASALEAEKEAIRAERPLHNAARN